MEVIDSKSWTLRPSLAHKKASEILSDLEESDRFEKVVTDFRKKLNIPDGGVVWDGEPSSFYIQHFHKNEARLKSLDSFGRLVTSQFKLDLYMKKVVEDYLIYNRSVPNPTILGHIDALEAPGCSMKRKNGDHVLIIHRGATKRDVLRALDMWWSYIEMSASEKKGMLRFKTKHHRQTDKVIFKLYELGVIRYNGTFNAENARSYLRQRGVEAGKTLLLESFRKLGITVPGSSEGRRKIIQKFRKLKTA